MPADTPSIVWFRQDLRLADHPALHAAVERGGPVLPVFIWSPEEEGDWAPGAASRYYLHRSLERLEAGLHRHHSRLTIRRGPAGEALRSICRETGADAVYWNRQYEPAAIERDQTAKEALRDEGLHVRTYNGSLFFDPWEVMNLSGEPYKVFTPFYNRCCALAEPAHPLPETTGMSRPDAWPDSLAIDALGLLPEVDWAGGIEGAWDFGEDGAHQRLQAFIDEDIHDYKRGQQRPDLDQSSRLSPHLHFGEITPRQIWHAVAEATSGAGFPRNAEAFIRQLYWREFSYYMLYHFPHTTGEALRPEFKDFPWTHDEDTLRRWHRGRTGYPIVDAAMRQLWHIGWMHNRARLVVASFLVKDLMLPWQEGARWFWDTLVDADLANNTMGWQWTAGCGADAAPFFRIFNPVTQGTRFDPKGDYVRRWVPELADMPDAHIHSPWEAPREVLDAAGVRLGDTYPRPMVDHGEARNEALAAYQRIKGKAS